MDSHNKHKYFMSLAIKQAVKAYKNNDTPIGCVIVFNKNEISFNNKNKKSIKKMIDRISNINKNKEYVILAQSYNKRNLKNDAIKHAEINAISKACKKINDFRLDGSIMYVTLEPCQMCAGAILQSRIIKLYIATKSEKSGSCGSIIDVLQNEKFNHKVEVSYGILEKESKKILKTYFKELRCKKNI